VFKGVYFQREGGEGGGEGKGRKGKERIGVPYPLLPRGGKGREGSPNWGVWIRQ